MNAHSVNIQIRDLARREMLDWLKIGKEILLPDGSPLFKRDANGAILEDNKGNPIIMRRRVNGSEMGQILKHLRQVGLATDDEPEAGAASVIRGIKRKGGLRMQPADHGIQDE